MVTTQKSALYTGWALSSFFAHTTLTDSDSFVLIDNDGGYEIPIDCLNYPIEVLRNGSPLSFAANVNAMARRAISKSDDLYFLNNDVIFTKNWLVGLQVPIDVVLVPLSNREIQYTLPKNGGADAFSCPLQMQLGEFIGHEQDLAQIVEMHQQQMTNKVPLLPVLCAPFFVVKLPCTILKSVGALDLRYGVGGGEDYDYCLRVHQAGFSVAYVQSSFLLHFGAKSIANPDKGSVEPQFISEFRAKWGESAQRVIFDDAPGVIEALGLRSYDFQKLGFTDLIKEMVGSTQVASYLPL